MTPTTVQNTELNFPPNDPKTVEQVLEVARKRLDRALEQETSNRDHALQCLKFRNLEQWDPEVKNAREKDPEGSRPTIVVDKTNQYIRQVLNEERQNRPAIKVRPIDDKGDVEVAEVLQGIIRHIEDLSGADLAYDTAYESAVDGGFGYFRIISEYCDPMSFEQDLRICRIRNRFTVIMDPDHQQPDGSDCQWVMILDKCPRDEFREQWPDADPLDFTTDGQVFNNWVFKDYVIVAEYFYIQRVKKKICLWESGQVSEKDKKPKVVYIGDKVVQERDTYINQVKWKKITARDILEERDLPGKYIPVVEVIGNELDIEGERVTSGLLKGAMEPQKIHNYAASAYVETVGMAPRAQWVAAEGQIEGHEELYRTANRRAITVLPYKPLVMDGGVPVPPPQRIAPAGVAPGWLQTLQITEHDIQASMGMYAETTLGIGDAKSGKQEALQQRRGDTATFHYMDNLSRSIRFAGRILIDLIPHYYDTERVARILGEEGDADQVMLDPNQPEAVRRVQKEDGAIQKIYNLNVGRYDVTVTTGPSFATKRMEAAEFLTNAMQGAKDPVTAQVLSYLALKNQDWAGTDEAVKMIKKLLPPQVQEEDDEDQPRVQTPKGPVTITEAGQIIAQLEGVVGRQTELIQAAEIEKQRAEAEKAQAAQAEVARKAAKDEADRILAEAESRRKDQELSLQVARLDIERYRAETERMKLGAAPDPNGEDELAQAGAIAAPIAADNAMAMQQ